MSQLRHDRLIRLGGRLFAVVQDSDRGLVELDANGFVKAQWPVIANATVFYRTGALSHYFGQPYILAVGEQVNIFPAPFLKGARKVLDVFTDGGTFALVLTLDPATGTIHRHEARLHGAVWQQADQSETDEVFINAAATGAGVVAHIPDNGVLLVYSSRSPKSQRVQSDLVRADMILEELDGRIVFFDGSVAYRIELHSGAG